jgi:hypothetical protein
MDVPAVQALHARMKALVTEKRWAEASALLPLLDGRSAVDLNSVEFVDLWWMFGEDLGDAIAAFDPVGAARAYELALVSWQKEGSYATGAGEGMSATINVRRLQEKLGAPA